MEKRRANDHESKFMVTKKSRTNAVATLRVFAVAAFCRVAVRLLVTLCVCAYPVYGYGRVVVFAFVQNKLVVIHHIRFI